MAKTALVTGVTSGIGKSTALALAGKGWNLIITGRRSDRLNELAAKIKGMGVEVLPLCFDVRDHDQVREHLAHLPENWTNIDVLINNAGLAVGLGTIDNGEVDDWERMIDTNVKGLLYVTKAIVPYMKKNGKGHIINIGSTAGKETYLNGNVYCATKHAVDSLTKGFRIDLLPFGIKVTGICPGMVDTEFSLVRFKGDTKRADKVYQGFQPLLPDDVANIIVYAIEQPEHVCLNDIVLTCTAQANSFYTHKPQ